MAEDIPVTGPGGTPPRPGYEGTWPRYAPGLELVAPAAARRVSWGAIFAGVVVALVVELLLGTLGLAILMGTIDPATEAGTLEGVGVGTGSWLALTAIVGLFFGGWTAGRLAGQPQRFDGAMHGIVAWGLVTLFSTWLLTNVVSGLVSGVLGVAGTTLGVVGQGVTAIAPAAFGAVGEQLLLQGIDPDAVGAEIDRFLRQTGDPQLSPESLRQRVDVAGERATEALGEAAQQPGNALDAINVALARLAAQGRAVVNEVDRQDAINVIVARTDLSEAQAAQVVDNWIRTWNDLRAQIGATTRQVGQTAARVTEDVTDAMGTFLAWSFVAMLLGLVAAGFGGAFGAPKTVAAPAVQVAGREQ